MLKTLDQIKARKAGSNSAIEPPPIVSFPKQNAMNAKNLISTFLLCGAVALPASRAQTNLLVNGSFEIPGITGAQDFVNGDLIGLGWYKQTNALESTLLGGSLPGYADAQDGSQRIQVGTVYTSFIYQAVNLTADVSYELSFYQSGVSGAASVVSAGITGNSGLSVSANHLGGVSWTQQSLVFTPFTTGTYFVIFEAEPGTNSTNAAVIDNVALTAAIPEPSTYAASVSVLALMAAGIRRRSRATKVSANA